MVEVGTGIDAGFKSASRISLCSETAFDPAADFERTDESRGGLAIFSLTSLSLMAGGFLEVLRDALAPPRGFLGLVLRPERLVFFGASSR